MDITTLFKACVKTVRTRNKAFGIAGGTDKHRILKTKRQKNDFSFRAKDILLQICRLRDFLLENRKGYLNFSNYLSDAPQLTDIERDQVDLGAQKIINTCKHLIDDFKKDSKKTEESLQVQNHMEVVIDLLEGFLKTVCKIYSEQKAIRVKRALEMRKLTKLESIKSSVKMENSNIGKNDLLERSNNSEVGRISQGLPIQNLLDEGVPLTNGDDQLSAEDMQIFESENAQLLNELNNVSEEVRQIESKVVQIAELQEIFTEKVLQQDQDIDRIATTVVGATENIQSANDQIRQAIQRNAGLRVWALFFLLVMSFSLLFLDWYND